jgi:hypothetical protein
MRTAHPTLTHRIRLSDDTRYLTISQVRERTLERERAKQASAS